MAPKAKPKGPVPTLATYAVPPAAPPPAPAPLPPHQRGIELRISNTAVFVLDNGSIREARRSSDETTRSTLQTAIELFEKQEGSPLRCRRMTVSRGALSNVLFQVERGGVAGNNTVEALYFFGSFAEDESPSALTKLELPRLAPNTETVLPRLINVAAGSGHVVCLFQRPGGTSELYGMGLVEGDPLSAQAARENAAVNTIPALVPLRCFVGEGISQIWAGESLTLARGNRGLFALGTLTAKTKWSEPTLIVPRFESDTLPLAAPEEVISVAIGSTKVYLLLSNRDILMLEEDASDHQPESPLTLSRSGTAGAARTCWNVTNVTSQLFHQKHRLRSSAHLFKVEEALTIEATPNKHFDALYAGKEHFIARDQSTGAVYGWGQNGFGQLGKPSVVGLECTQAVRIHMEDAVEWKRLPVDAGEAPSLNGGQSSIPCAVGCGSWSTHFYFLDGSLRKLGMY